MYLFDRDYIRMCSLFYFLSRIVLVADHIIITIIVIINYYYNYIIDISERFRGRLLCITLYGRRRVAVTAPYTQ